MKAVLYERYGTHDVLELQEVGIPAVMEDEVRVRVRAAAAHIGDWRLLTATPWVVRLHSGMRKPKRPILGHDFAGTIDAVGKNVSRFQAGDKVYGMSTNAGAFAEYISVPEYGVALKPPKLTDEETAVVPHGALTALQGLRDKGRIQSGQNVLIIGASGAVGTLAVQIAKAFGAKVTGVCSTGRMDMVRSIGADHVIDYRQEDFARSGTRYDLIYDLVGDRPIRDYRSSLDQGGVYVAVSGAPTRLLWIALTGRGQFVTLITQPNCEDLEFINELLLTGKLTPIMDRCYSLSELPEALRYIGEGHAQGHSRGKIAVTV